MNRPDEQANQMNTKTAYRNMFFCLCLACMLYMFGCVYSQDGYISGDVSINGSASSINISHYNLSYRSLDSSTWENTGLTIDDPQQSLAMDTIGEWDTSFIPDGEYVLRLNVTDNYSQSSLDYVYINVDNLYISYPENETILDKAGTLDFIGTAMGGRYENYTIEYANASTPDLWSDNGITLIDNGYPNKSNSTLGYLDHSLNLCGIECLFRIQMQNQGGFNNTVMLALSFMEQDAFEPDDNASAASWILTDGTHQAHTLVPEYDIDFIRFNATAEMKYEIGTYDTGDGSDPDTVIFFYQDTPPADWDISDYLSGYDDYDDDSGDGYYSLFEFTANETKTYYAAVIDYYGDVGGSYNISVEEHDRYYKGIIPTSYAVPFYTFDENPKTCEDVSYGEYCNASWSVNVMADIGEEYDFFTIIDDVSGQNETNKTRVTIAESSPPVITIVYPANGTSFYQNTTSVVINISTDIPSDCVYSLIPNFYYYDGFDFSVTGGTAHATTLYTDNDTDYYLYYLCLGTQYYDLSEMTHHYFNTKNVSEDDDEEEEQEDEEEEEEEDDDDTGTTGGGSSSGTSATTALTTEDDDGSVDLLYDSLASGRLLNIKVDADDFALTNFKATLTQNITGISNIRIHRYTGKTGTPPGFVYQLIEIAHSNLDSNKLDDITIEFRVPKSWVTQNNGSQSGVALYRYTQQWDKLRTVYDSADSQYYHYIAQTPGMSVFAITLTVEEEPDIAVTSITIENITDNATVAADDTPVLQNISSVVPTEPPEEKSGSLKAVISAVFGIFVAIVLVALLLVYKDQISEALEKVAEKFRKKEQQGSNSYAQMQNPNVRTHKALPQSPAQEKFKRLCREFMLYTQQGMSMDEMIRTMLAEGYPSDMINKAHVEITNLTQYIQRELRKGYDPKLIKEKVLKSGWDMEEEITNLIVYMIGK